MTYAVIENSIVTNLISAEPKGAESLISAGMNLVPTEKPITIGDSYDGVTFFRDGEEVLTPLEIAQKENEELVAMIGNVVDEQYNKDLEVLNNV